MKIVFRSDSSTQIGTGHIIRDLVLARELTQRGAQVSFICRDLAGNVSDKIEAEKDITLYRLPYKPASQAEDAQETIQILSDKNIKPDWLIVDHYDLDVNWQKQLRRYVKKIMVIDDIANRNHDCDILLDQNFAISPEQRYKNHVSKTCRQLLGPKYAILRPEFSEARQGMPARTGEVKRILVLFGGADPDNQTSKAIEALQLIKHQNITVDVIIGAANPHRKKIESLAAKAANITCHYNFAKVSELMKLADLSIGAGGTTTWERCCLGLPSITIAIADNQVPSSEALAVNGCHLYLGKQGEVSVQVLGAAIEICLQSRWLNVRFSQSTLNLVDGKGCQRIANELMPLTILLKSAVAEDCKKVYEWRNDDEIRKQSFNSRALPFEEHEKWFQSTLSRSDRALLIGYLDNTPIGVLRFDLSEKLAVVSIYLVPGKAGMGLGVALLRQGSKWIHQNHPEVRKLVAEVKIENEASRSAFLAAGYSGTNITFEKNLN